MRRASRTLTVALTLARAVLVTGGFLFAVGAAVLPFGAAAVADALGVVTCPAGAQSPELDAARARLEQDEGALDPRLKFADALLAQACYWDAVHVLEEGETLHPRSGAIQSRLRDARSMLSEQRYFDGLGRAEEAAKIQRNLLRCRKLGDVSACDEALRARPNDGEILIAKGDALMQSNHPADALPVYRRAAELAPTDAGVKEKITTAESQRHTLLSQCEHDSADAALQACQLALLRGASDEFFVHQRKGILLQGMDKPSQALDSYIAANLLQANDRSVALAIVALTGSTGRKDALALSARGNALLTLGRGAEGLQALRQAQALSPALPDIRVRLVVAETVAREEARRNAAAAQAAKVAAAAAAATAATNAAAKVAADASANATADQERTRVASEPKPTYSNDGPVSRSH